MILGIIIGFIIGCIFNLAVGYMILWIEAKYLGPAHYTYDTRPEENRTYEVDGLKLKWKRP